MKLNEDFQIPWCSCMNMGFLVLQCMMSVIRMKVALTITKLGHTYGDELCHTKLCSLWLALHSNRFSVTQWIHHWQSQTFDWCGQVYERMSVYILIFTTECSASQWCMFVSFFFSYCLIGLAIYFLIFFFKFWLVFFLFVIWLRWIWPYWPPPGYVCQRGAHKWHTNGTHIGYGILPSRARQHML